MTAREFTDGIVSDPDSIRPTTNSTVTSKDAPPLFHSSGTNSINSIKMKIKNIMSKIEDKCKVSPNHGPKQSKNFSFDYSQIRRTANFTGSHKKSEKSHDLAISPQTETLVEKAYESIRKSYQLSLKNKYQQLDTPDTFPDVQTPNSKDSMNSFDKLSKSFNKKNLAKQDLNSKSFINQKSVAAEKGYKHSENSSQKHMNKSWVGKTSSQVIKERENILPAYVKYFSQKRSQNGFVYGRLLGKGKFGQVFLAQHEETGFIVAIKKVSKTKLKQYNMVERFIEQIKLHSMLDHPNIVKFYGFFEEKENICLILEYLNGGTLFDYMNQVGTLSMKQAVRFLRQIIEALTYVHQKDICHRDIKPENIVISSYTGLAKLCDFGWSTLTQTPRETFCGTLDYASPQIIERQPYDEAVDVWCVGVLTYEMFVGRAPFQNSDRSAVMTSILNVDKTGIPYIENLPPEAKEFIEALLVKDPTQRPKMFELLLYPLFQIDLNTSKRKGKGHQT